MICKKVLPLFAQTMIAGLLAQLVQSITLTG